MKLLPALAVFAALLPAAYADNAPKLHFGVRHTQADGSQVLNAPENGTVRVRDNLPVCWVAAGLPPDSRDNVLEHFRSPAPAQFDRYDVVVASYRNGTAHDIHSRLQPDAAGQHVSCWRFGDNDPAGEYALTVQIGRHIFPTYRFELQK